VPPLAQSMITSTSHGQTLVQPPERTLTPFVWVQRDTKATRDMTFR